MTFKLPEPVAMVGGIAQPVFTADQVLAAYEQGRADRDSLAAEVKRLTKTLDDHKDNWLAWADKRESLEKDAARLDWLEQEWGCNLVNDDGGRWTVSDAGIQPAPEENGFKEDVTIACICWKENWHPTIRAALDAAIDAAPKESAPRAIQAPKEGA